MKTAAVQVTTMATAPPRRRIPHRCRATTRGFRIRQTNPATAIISRTSRIRYASLPARYVRTTTATVTRMVASGTPRLAAASRRRLCRTCTAVTLSTWAGAAFAVSARADLAALTGCSPFLRVARRSGCVAQFGQRLHVAAQVADLDADRDLREAVDQGVQAEQQGQGDRAHAGTGEQQYPERDRHQPAEDEHGAGGRGLPGLETGEDLGEAAGQRPRRHDDDQHERGRRGPGQGEHPGRQVDQPEQQVTEDRAGGPGAEGPRALQSRVQERVDREQDDQRENRDAWPGDGQDPGDDSQNAEQNQRGG